MHCTRSELQVSIPTLIRLQANYSRENSQRTVPIKIDRPALALPPSPPATMAFFLSDPFEDDINSCISGGFKVYTLTTADWKKASICNSFLFMYLNGPGCPNISEFNHTFCSHLRP